jgi:hypothetical protein
MKCRVIKKAWCPLRKGYMMPGETIEVPEKLLKSYLPYVQPLETARRKPEKGDKAKQTPEDVENAAEKPEDIETAKKSGDQ